MLHAILALNLSIDRHQLGFEQYAALPVGQVTPDDDVYHAVFVFECHERHTAGSLRTLSKNYSARNQRSLDFVLMFIPIEGALAAALQVRPELQADAIAKKVAIVSPMTLYTTLGTIEFCWRVDKTSKSLNEIIRRGQLLYDEAARLGESLLDLEKKLHLSRESFDELRTRLVDPSRGVIRRAQELKKLGVGSKSRKAMPAVLASEVDGGDDLEKTLQLAMDVDADASAIPEDAVAGRALP